MKTTCRPRARALLPLPFLFLIFLSLILFFVNFLGQVCLAKGSAENEEANALKQLSLEQLGSVQVTTASKEPETVWKTPAAVYVITHDAIMRSGATSIPEALRLAPGVEVARVDNDKWSIGIRGFGPQALELKDILLSTFKKHSSDAPRDDLTIVVCAQVKS